MKKLRVTVNGTSYDVEVEVLEDDDVGGSSYGFPPVTSGPRPSPAPKSAPPSGGGSAAPGAAQPKQSAPAPSGSNKEVTSPIAGVVAEVHVSVGTEVKENDLLVILEAMKMHTNISSPVSGKVKEIRVKSGDAVQQGQILLTFE